MAKHERPGDQSDNEAELLAALASVSGATADSVWETGEGRGPGENVKTHDMLVDGFEALSAFFTIASVDDGQPTEYLVTTMTSGDHGIALYFTRQTWSAFVDMVGHTIVARQLLDRRN